MKPEVDPKLKPEVESPMTPEAQSVGKPEMEPTMEEDVPSGNQQHTQEEETRDDVADHTRAIEEQETDEQQLEQLLRTIAIH